MFQPRDSTWKTRRKARSRCVVFAEISFVNRSDDHNLRFSMWLMRASRSRNLRLVFSLRSLTLVDMKSFY